MNLDVDEIADKFCEFPDILSYKDRMKVIVLLHKEKGFDIKTDSYIETNFKINKCIPNVFGIKKKEIKEKILFAVSSETVNKETVLAKGVFEEQYSGLLQTKETMELEKKMETLEKQNQELQKELKELKETKTPHITNVLIPHIYINVKMNGLGEEDMNNLTPDDFKLLLDKSTSAADFIDTSIRRIHYDKEKPENHNIHITEKRDEHTKCVYYGNNRWHLDAYIGSSYTMFRLLNGKIKLIDRMLEYYYDKFSPKDIDKMRSFRNLLGDTSDHYYKTIATDVIYSCTKIDVPEFRQSLKQLQ
jgi:predicted transcriptional regulator